MSDFMVWPTCADGAARQLVRAPYGVFSVSAEDAISMERAASVSR